MRYLFYVAEDFFKDEYFIQWVTNPTVESNLFWQKFLQENPHKQHDVDLAISYIKKLQFTEIAPSPEDLYRVQQNIQKAIQLQNKNRSTQRVLWYSAAAIALLLLVSTFLLTEKASTITLKEYSTKYGEIKEITLPDGTLVTLNSNSTLTAFTKIDSTNREVWLTGEAFFNVTKKNDLKFIVHTNDTDIEVLGTSFNVKERKKGTQIVLNEGSVQIKAEGKDGPILKPGDMAVISAHEKDSIKVTIVKPEHHIVWKEKFLLMDDHTVAQIIEELKDLYNLNITVENIELLNKRLSGKISTQNADDLIEDLALSLGVSVSKSDSVYIFR